MKYGSLFSGIGGFDLGFDRAGMECAWQCEIDKAACAIEERHYPNVKRYNDVRSINSNNAEPVDVICGGFPCQDLSVAGKRAGLTGERSGLWFEFERIIGELRPRWVVIENVPGLLSSNRGNDFAIILQGLVKFGYGVVWRVLDAQYFGVAQRRRRVFIVASLGDGRAAQVLFEREGVRWNPPPRGKAGEEITACASSSFGGYSEGMGTLRATGGDYGGGTEILIANSICAKKGTRNNPNNEMFIPWTDQGGSRMDLGDNVSTTLRHQDHGHPPLVGVRRLTPTECERLQGFPDGWTDGQSDSARYEQLGNAVCVNKLEWIGGRIVEAEAL